ncbi:class I SAM-dependent methyltransferase [Saccharothrix variisporea]|uniref:Methyltransferase family protein n=1 Tax=Saccharothrix variisporea TaxID=543527 RepID=A0A495XCL5_9PSEU|nr:methyltransferase family protein [Saccharothrix variisporea]
MVLSVGYHEWHAKPGYYNDIVRHFRPGSRILDVGCGTAWVSEFFPDYVGLDNFQSTVDKAKEQGIDVRLADLEEDLPVGDHEFDGVVLKDVLEHLLDPVSLVKEVRRVLKPGGRVFASSPDAQRWSWNDYTHRRPWTRTSMRRLFEDQGFDVKKVSYESVMPGSSIISGLLPAKRRPAPLVAATWLPGWRRNVWILATSPAS